MQCRHDLSTFPDRGRYPLDRTRAHVADGEDAAAARLKGMALLACRGSGADEPFAIQRDVASCEPVSIGIRTNEQEEVADRACPFLSLAVAPPDAIRDSLPVRPAP